jgi:hypothetical protein
VALVWCRLGPHRLKGVGKVKCGYTENEVADLWDVVSKDAFKYFGWNRGVDVHFSKVETDVIAYTSFRSNPFDLSPVAMISEHAQHVVFNTTYLPHIFEDEMIGVMLHEIAHAVGPLFDMHYAPWRQRATEIGGCNDEFLFIRNWSKLPHADLVASQHRGYKVFYQFETPLEGYHTRVAPLQDNFHYNPNWSGTTFPITVSKG